ncbi:MULTISPECIES: FAD-binding oxidoreductase [Methylobacterium]|uniref:FAD-binding oxidoreductase n=1 Tax=Methylobacterium TaxID=407 RepID=UPI0028A975ED|nr:FAD-binding protein [Methylobacterium sp. DB0501]
MQNPGGVTDRLIALVGRTNVILPVDDQEPYTVDWRGRYRGDALAVVRPGSTQEVAEVVRLLVAAGVAILPQGGNTGLCGAAIPSGGRPSVIVRLDRMRRIAGIALTTFTGVMVSITKGSFVIPLAVAGCLGLVGAASYLFNVGEIAPLKAKGDDDEGGAPAPALAT